MQTLRDTLGSNWHDVDLLAVSLARLLGVIDEGGDAFGGQKWMFWSTNPAGDALFRFIKELVAIGFLEEHPDDNTSVRIHPRFRLDRSS